MRPPGARWRLALLLWASGPAWAAAAGEGWRCIKGDARQKVACIGASITKGSVRIFAGVASTRPYPEQLGELLGPDFCVENFGIPGTTALKHSKQPYWHYHNTIDKIMAMKPDVVVMQFGANDSKERNMHQDFEADYTGLIKLFKEAESRPAVYIMAAPPIYMCTPRGAQIYGMDANIVNGLQNQMEQITAMSEISPPISVFNAFKRHCPDLNSKCAWMAADGVHPNEHGDRAMAGLVATAIVHGSRCTVLPAEREDCGFQHITEEGCRKKGCCYRPAGTDGTPWCFRKLPPPPTPTLAQCAALLDEEKTECGTVTDTDVQCQALGCCWAVAAFPGTPSCFRPMPARLLRFTTRTATTSTQTWTTTTSTTFTTTVTMTTITFTMTGTTTTSTTTTTIPSLLQILNGGKEPDEQTKTLALFAAVAASALLACCCLLRSCCCASPKMVKQISQETRDVTAFSTLPETGTAMRSNQWKQAHPRDFMMEETTTLPPEQMPLMSSIGHNSPQVPLPDPSTWQTAGDDDLEVLKGDLLDGSPAKGACSPGLTHGLTSDCMVQAVADCKPAEEAAPAQDSQAPVTEEAPDAPDAPDAPEQGGGSDDVEVEEGSGAASPEPLSASPKVQGHLSDNE